VKIQAIRKEEGSHSFWCDRPVARNKSRVGEGEGRGGEVMPPPRQEHLLGKGATSIAPCSTTVPQKQYGTIANVHRAACPVNYSL